MNAVSDALGPVARRAPTRRADAGSGAAGRLSIRALSGMAIAALAANVLVVVVALVWTTIHMERSADALTEAHESVEIVNAIESGVLRYRRFSEYAIVTGDPSATAARRTARQDITAQLGRARELVADNPREAELLAAVERDLGRYFEVHERAARTGLSFPEAMAQGRVPLEAVLSTLETIAALESRDLDQTNADVDRTERVAGAVAALSSLALVISLVAILALTRRLVVAPVVALSRTMTGFRRGLLEARAPAGGARELRSAAEAFNDMADALVRQRRAQLAYLAGVVHDIRNPLAALKLGLRGLEPSGDPVAHARTSALVARQVDRLSRLVSDVLDATQIEAGKLELEREPYDLRRSVREILELYAPTATAHPITAELPDAPVMAEIDPARIEQVLGNLLSNAIKYSPGGGHITLRVLGDERGCAVEVIDHGIGIAPDALEDIFAPFRRRAPEVGLGAGLGLSVARRIVEAHGGWIEVESELGRGSTFRVHLPRAADDEAPGEE